MVVVTMVVRVVADGGGGGGGGELIVAAAQRKRPVSCLFRRILHSCYDERTLLYLFLFISF